MKFYYSFLITAACLLAAIPVYSQEKDSINTEEIYKVIPWMSGGIAGVGLITNVLGLPRIKKKDPLTPEELENLKFEDVSRFNRAGLRQNVNNRELAHSVSNRIMYASAAMPLFLSLDKKVRGSYWKISLMYLETLSLTSNLYTYSPIGPTFIDRYRPLAYYEELSFEERSNGNQRNSFFSGHVSTTAVGTFFTAKVLADHHPEWGKRKILVYTLAAIPPAMVGVLRVRALKHFPSDVIAGGIVGAGMGLLIPTLHKKWQDRVTMAGAYSSDFKGGSLVITF